MKALIGFLILALSFCAQASSNSSVDLGDADADVFDLESVRRGAAAYVNYCVGCHSVKHLRYSRLGADLKLKEDDLRKDVLLDGLKIQDSLLSAMDKEDAQEWFGVEPPDLSLIARARGVDWLYGYLKGFYADPSRPSGVNNVVFPDVGMPNVLWELQGLQKAVHNAKGDDKAITRLELAQPGKLTPKQYDQFVNDLVAFLSYAGEPSQYQRLRLGKYVIFGLLILAVLFYKLKKAYWEGVE
ncbi:cytochrome c1 [Methylococcus sp. EFPC2]|nr:cytochrome c1 [Methylococcus sp. EFPC2]QSA99079.1 cytochrome c1 [Methylococcus sp. EFPC2]